MESSTLLEEVCTSFEEAIAALDGPLERAVEAAAASCWDKRDKKVQVKGRMFRSKTLIIEEPIFLNDAEQALGDTLAHWEHEAIGGVVAQLIRLKVAELQLIQESSAASKGSNSTSLQALDSVLHLHQQLHQNDSFWKDNSPDTVKLVKVVAAQIASVLNDANVTEGLIKLAAKYPEAMDDGLIQLPMHIDLESILHVLHELSLTLQHPKTISWLLSRLSIAIHSTSVDAVFRNASSLCKTLCALKIDMNDTLEECRLAFLAIQSCLLSIAQLSSSRDEQRYVSEAVESLLQILLSLSKGISTQDVWRALGFDSDSSKASLTSVSIPDLAQYIFSMPRPGDGASSNVLVAQATVLETLYRSASPWAQLFRRLPLKLGLRWLLVLVSSIRALACHDDMSSNTVTLMSVNSDAEASLVEEMTSSWLQLGIPGSLIENITDDDEQECYSLCMLELPPGEARNVQLGWRMVQATVGLGCACYKSGRGEDEDKSRQFLVEARIEEAFAQAADASQGWRTQVVLVCLHAIRCISRHAIYPDEGTLITDSPILELLITFIVRVILVSLHNQNGQPVSKMSYHPLRLVHAAINSSRDANDLCVLFGIASALCCLLYAPSIDLASHVPQAVRALVEEIIKIGCCSIYPALASNTPLVAYALKNIGIASKSTFEILAANGHGDNEASIVMVMAERMERVWMTALECTESSNVWVLITCLWISDALHQNQNSVGHQLSIECERAAAECLSIQDYFAQHRTSDSSTAAAELIMLSELVYRCTCFPDQLSPLVDDANIERLVHERLDSLHLDSDLGSEGTTVFKKEVLTDLMDLLGTTRSPLIENNEEHPDSIQMKSIQPIVASSALATIVTSSKEFQKTGGEREFLADVFGESVSQINEQEGGQEANRLRLDSPSSLEISSMLDWLVHQQQRLDDKRAEALSQLRSWRRRAEKAAARPAGEVVGPGSGEGREGDVPLCLAEAQRLSWELWYRVREDIKGYHEALRKRVCQQYLAVDEHTLQETSEVYADGQRIFCQLRDTRHEAICRSLRADAHAVAKRFMTNNTKDMINLTMELFGTEVMVYEARETGPELISVVVNSMLDGSTPSPAVPFFVTLVERTESPSGLTAKDKGRQSCPGQAQAQVLVPKIVRALGPKGINTEPPLSIDHGLRLLRAVLDPDALLDAKRLAEFGAALRLVVELCPECKSLGAAAMVRQFDAQRFAFLVAEDSARSESSPKDVASTTSAADSSAGAVAGVLSTVAACFRGVYHSDENAVSFQSALSSTAASLLEGLLACRPAEQYLPSLKVVVEALLGRDAPHYSPDAAASVVGPSLRLLSHVPSEILSPHTLASSLDVLATYLTAETSEKASTLSPASPLWDVIATLYGTIISGTLQDKQQDAGKAERDREERHVLNLISALLAAMHWVATSAGMDVSTFGESLQRMLTIIFVPESQTGRGESGITPWNVEWAWRLYQTNLTDFGSSSFLGSFPEDCMEIARGAFETVWSSLSWQNFFSSSLHLSSDDVKLHDKVTQLSNYLRFAADGAAIHVMKAVQDQDWEALVERALHQSKGALTVQGTPAGHRDLSTDLALLILESFVTYNVADLPRILLTDSRLEAHDSSDLPFTSSSLAVTLLAHADWRALNSIDSSTPGHGDQQSSSWLVSRLLSTIGWSTTEENDPLDRLVNVSRLLCAGATASSSPEALSVASFMIHPLVGLSICRCVEAGRTPENHDDRANEEDVFPDIPEELLQGTVEMQAIQEMRSRREILRLMEQDERGGDRGSAAAGSAPSGEAMGRRVVEVQGCLRMTPAQAVLLYESALIPLAKAAIGNVTTPGTLGEGESKAPLYSEMDSMMQHDSIMALCLPLTRRPTVTLTTISSARFPQPNADIPWYEETEQPVEENEGDEGLGLSMGQEPLFVYAGPDKGPETALTSQRRQWTSARYWAGVLKGDHSLRGSQFQSSRDDDDDNDDDLNSSSRFKGEVAKLLCRCARNDKDLAVALFRCCISCFMDSVPQTGQRASLYDVAEILVRDAVGRSADPEAPYGSNDDISVTVLDEYDQINSSKTMARNRLAQAISVVDTAKLISCARSAAAAHHPFLAAFFLETARRNATLLEKMSWQRIVVDVLVVAAEADVSVTDARSVLVLSLWLAALSWLDDPRWRKLPPGGHTIALGNLLDSLDSRVDILHSVTPEELVDGLGTRPFAHGVGGGRPVAFSRDLLAKARARVAGAVGGVFHRDKSEERAGETGTFLPSTYHGYTIPEASSDGGDGGSICADGEGVHPQALEGSDRREGEGRGLRAGIRSFGRSLSQAPGRVGRLLTLGSKGKREDVTTRLQETEQVAVDPPPHVHQVLAESKKEGKGTEIDVIVRIGLAAYAVAAYVRSVMDPRLTRRTVSGQAGLESGVNQQLPATSTHRRGNSSWTGSRHLEEAQLGEMDTLVEAQWHVDGLKELERSPLLSGKSTEFAEFWTQMPSLLTSATGVHEFQRATAKLLLETGQEASLVIKTLSG